MGKAEQGVSRDRYLLIPRSLSFIFHGERVLLIKGAPTKRLWAGKYNAIGGHIERGEDATSSAQREVLEETGIQAASLRLVGTVLVDASEEVGVALLVFRGEFAGGELRESAEGALEWVAVDQVDRLPLVADLSILLERVLRMGENDAPFSARSYYDAQDQLVVQFAGEGG